MRSNKKFQKSAVLCLIGGAMLTTSACGSSSTNALEEVKDRGTIRIATSGNFVPFIMRDSGNELVGIDADWAQIVADDLGVEIEWVATEFKGIIPGLNQDRYDAALSGIHVTPERQQVVAFSTPYAYDSTVAVFAEDGAPVAGPDDIEDKSVCTVAGSVFEATLKEIGGYKEIVPFTGIAESLQGLRDGRCDVAVSGRATALYWIKSGQGEGFTVSEKDIAGEPVAIAVNKANPELLEAINEAISTALPEECQKIATEWTGNELPAAICSPTG